MATSPSPPPPSSSSRRPPPPCWSHDETSALIDAYREKWYSLRRGNLRAQHWQEVADGVSIRSPPIPGNPSKTPVQCRHKMEKLRKRHRNELQRAASNPNLNRHRYISSWAHFHKMDSMENGPNSQFQNQHHQEEDDDYEEEDVYLKPKHAFRIRIPGRPNTPTPTPTPNYEPSRVKKREGDAVGEMVWAIKVLGDGFVRMEKMKMEMAREVEAMRMDMEMKRTQMILDSQHRIVEAFVKGLSDANHNKKPKRMITTPDS